jgi:predicted dehydrogenase
VEKTYADAKGKQAYKGCKGYVDYFEMLARPDIDAVLIATPIHWHAMMTVMAAKAGKDVYCEKPIALTVREGGAMQDAIRRYGRVFQAGTQQRRPFNELLQTTPSSVGASLLPQAQRDADGKSG